jgi:hypothetical protein
MEFTRVMSTPDQAPYSDPSFDDREEEFAAENDIATNDAVAGETVTPGVGEGNDGPTGGSPREATPTLDEHEESIDVATRNPTDFDNRGE